MNSSVAHVRPPSPQPKGRVALADLIPHPMPSWVRGALVTRVSANLDTPVLATWFSPEEGPLRPGSLLVSWRPATTGYTEVIARLGLAGSEVTLAIWPRLHGDWTAVIRPTLHEVSGLHAALTVAKEALGLANHLLDSR